jgi:predicted Zn-dependent protease with MMP-like domain
VVNAHRALGRDLTRLVRHLMVHEIGHHFGFSDEDRERIEESAG